jgi:hypothetical protein
MNLVKVRPAVGPRSRSEVARIHERLPYTLIGEEKELTRVERTLIVTTAVVKNHTTRLRRNADLYRKQQRTATMPF